MFSTVLKYGILSQGGVTPFTPLSLSGCTSWFAELVNGGTDRSSLSNGDNITQWDDKSGNDYHLTGNTAGSGTIQYNSTEDSVYINGVYSGGRAILQRFPGWISGIGTFTAFFVAKPTSTQSNYFVTIGQYSCSGCACILARNGSTQYGSNNLFDGASIFGGQIPQNQQVVFTFCKTGSLAADIDLGLQGEFQSLARSSTGSTVSINSACIMVGGYFDGGTYVSRTNSHMYEFITYDRQLSASEIDQVETYLNNKYSVY